MDSTVALASLLQGRVLSLHVAADYGSCSFTSPIDGLRSSEWMGSDSIRGEAEHLPAAFLHSTSSPGRGFKVPGNVPGTRGGGGGT
ncbi:unnamed protein product [Arctogadus glacialis]